MRLLTHNLMICTVAGCVDNYPLRVTGTTVEQDDTDANGDMLRGLWPKIRYPALLSALADLGLMDDELPEEVDLANAQHLLVLHKYLMDTHVVEGDLCCPKCGRKYKITQGIPNMLLREDEV